MLAKDPQNADAYLLIARRYVSQERYHDATRIAEYANAIGAGSGALDELMLSIYAPRRDWSNVCEVASRLAQTTPAWDPEKVSLFREAYSHTQAFGCYLYLSQFEGQWENLPRSSEQIVRYALKLAEAGQTEAAIAVLSSYGETASRQYLVAKLLYQGQRHEEAAQKLFEYLDGAEDETERERRIKMAAQICNEFSQWETEAKILSRSQSISSLLPRAIALANSGKTDEALALLPLYFSSTEPDKTEIVEGLRLVLQSLSAEAAYQAYTGTHFRQDPDFVMDVFQHFSNHKGGTFAEKFQIDLELSRLNLDDTAVFERLFSFFHSRGMYADAMEVCERAMALGYRKTDFALRLIELYAKTSQFQRMYRLAESLLNEAEDEEAADALRRRFARVFYDKNAGWEQIRAFLEPLDSRDKLDRAEREMLYQALSNLQAFDLLYEKLESRRNSGLIDHLEVVQYFSSSSASEKQFLAALAPLLSAENQAQTAQMVLAAYYYDVKDDHEAGKMAIDAAISRDNSPASYRTVVDFFQKRVLFSQALSYAKTWQTLAPDDADVHAIVGRLYLHSRDAESSGNAFSRYVDSRPNKYEAIRFGYDEFVRFNENAEGYAWVLAQHAKYSQNPALEEASLRALLEAAYYESERLASIDPAASKALREDMHTGYARLIDIQTAEARVGTGIFLESIRNDALAVKAFTGSQDARSYGKGAKLAHIRACLRSGCQDKVTLKIIDTFHQQTDIDDLLSLLEREQRLDLAQVPLTRMLSKGDLKARIAAYQSLVRLAAERNDETQIARYRQQLEQSDPRNADIQKILAQTCIQRGLWDDAVRHLTYLTILRPDSREVLDLSFSLSKRAPEHEGAQRLWQSQLQAARGKFHRLEWIAQAYERYGQTQEALTWYEEARRFGTIPNHILLRLAIALSDEHRQREYRNQLSRSDYAQLFDLVSLYQSMGNWTEARHLIQHYMHAYPSDQSAQMNVRLKQENLKIAMDSGDMDLIRMRLAEAIAHPVAEVMIPLLERGAMLNAMDAIELFEAEGQFEMALDSLIRIEDAHMQVNSLPVTQQTMQRYVSFSPRHSSQVAARMANQALLGPSPCEALLYLPSTTQPELWASALLACPQATSSIKEALSALRANMTKRRRSAFDQQLYEILAASNSDFIPQAQSLITHTDLDVRAIQRIETSLRQENPLQALQCFYTCAMPDQDIPKALASFAQYGYDKESIEAASSVWPMLSDTWRLEVAWHMANFGVKSDNISDALRKASPDRWTMPISKEVILAIPEDVIVYWIDHAPPHAFGNVISMALQHVSTNPNHSDLIGHLTKNIHSRPQKLTFLLQFADHALRYGYEFNREAQEALRDALKIQPDSELIWLKLSVAQGQHCVLLPSESPCGTLSTTEQCSQIDDAIISLEKGSHMAMQISEYWHEAARLHHLSPIELRRHIHSQRHAHSPNTVNMMLDDLALNLEENHADKAVAIARVLSEGAAPFLWMQIAGKFTQAKAEIPDFLTKADHAYAQQLAARRALDTGDLHQAATHYQQAASLSLWPLEIYEEAMQAFASRQAWNVLEQFIDQTLQAYPHAYLPYLWRAILRVERGDIEQAMNDYRKARSRSFDSNTILVPMFVTLAKHEYVDLALEVLEQTPKALRRHDLILRALADNTRNDARAAAKRLDFANRVLALSDTDILASEPLLSAYLYLTGVANDTARSRQLRRLHAIRMP